jgi:RNAse (barnase) inhibitor barstar
MATNSFYTEGHTRYVFVDGLLCDTMEKVYATLKTQLSLPGYFGNNLDALNEVLNDLEWVKEKKVKLIVLNVGALLENDHQKKEGLISVLKEVDSKKLQVLII